MWHGRQFGPASIYMFFIDYNNISMCYIVLEMAQSRWRWSVQPQIDMLDVGDKHLHLNRWWRRTMSIQARMETVEVGDEHAGLNRHIGGGRQAFVLE